MTLGLNVTGSSQDSDSNYCATESERACGEADFDKLMDQQDHHEARSKRRKLDETADTSAAVNKSVASFKPDFCDVLQHVLSVVEQTDRKSEIVKESAELVATLSLHK